MSEDLPAEAGPDGVPDVGEMVEHGRLSPDDAFGMLQNEVRLSILRVLWDADDSPISYAELERRTPVDTENFYYHLEQLVGHFVRRTDDGYELRYAGEVVVRAIVAGVITEDVSLPPREIDSRCPYCESAIEIQYVDELLTARCTGCGGVVRGDEFPPGTILSYYFPPSGLFGRSPEQVLEAAHVLYDAKVTPMLNGVCPECAATVDHSLHYCESHKPRADGVCDDCRSRFAVWTVHTCEHCGYTRQFVPWFKLLTEPAVISFYHEESDFDRRIPFSKLTWENAPYVRSISQSVVSTDPLRIRVRLPIEDAVLRVTMDEDLEIVDIERSTVTGE